MFHFPGVYPPEVEKRMRNYFWSVSEKDRRRYGAAEAIKLGHGGITYIAGVLGCSRDIIHHGRRELEQLPDDIAGNRIRKPGAGRKKTEEKQPGVIEQVQQTVEDRTAGDPMREEARRRVDEQERRRA